MDRNAERETIRRLREKTLQTTPAPRASSGGERAASARNRLRMAAADLQLGRIVQRNPWATVGAFAAAGFAIGYWPALARSLAMGAAAAMKNMPKSRSRLRRTMK